MKAGMVRLVGVLVLASLMSGCKSSEVVQASGPRPALQPSAVRIYQTAPKKYEKHGLIEVPVTDRGALVDVDTPEALRGVKAEIEGG